MEKSLKEMFFESLETFETFETTNEPVNSTEIQQKIKQTIKWLEKCTEQVSEIDIFATNEQIDELETSSIPFLLLPALLGNLTLKLCGCSRDHVIKVAEIYFRDFLKRCSHYGLCDYDGKVGTVETEAVVEAAAVAATAAPKPKTTIMSMTEMARCRQSKIARFKEKKQLEETLRSLKNRMDANKDRDEQLEREYYLNLVKSFINQSIGELESIEMEKPFIEYRQRLKNQRKLYRGVSDDVADDDDEDSDSHRLDSSRKSSFESRNLNEFAKKNSLNAIVIARNRAEKLVFGAGYPSLPVMSVEEFYEKRVRDGIFPGAGCSRAPPPVTQGEEDEKVVEELKLEADDAEMLAKLRLQDDYKDDHRRGWGNRYNRS